MCFQRCATRACPSNECEMETSGELDASSQRDFEAELQWRGIARRDWHSPEMERIGATVDYATKARTATAEPGAANETAIDVGKVRQPSIRVGKELGRLTETFFEFAARPEDFLVRCDVDDRPEVDMRPCMDPEFEPALVQRSHLVPRHPGILHALLTVPPGDDVGADPLGNDEEGGRQPQFFQHWRRVLEVVPIPVVKRDRQFAIQMSALFQLVDQVGERHDIEVPLEEPAVLLEQPNANGESFGLLGVQHPMECDDHSAVSQQERIEMRLENRAAEQTFNPAFH